MHYPPIDYQNIIYYSAPKQKGDGPKSLDEVDPKLLETYEKLGIPLRERERLAGVAVDAVFDSVSVATTFKEKLAEKGIIFCSFSEAVQEHPDLVRKYLGSVVPYTDNFFAALNSAVFSDGSFCYIPKGVRCPMELSTYFRINAANTGQFERTLIVAEEGALRQLPGRLHGADARREPAARGGGGADRAGQRARSNTPPCRTGIRATRKGEGGIYNFVTKRGLVQRPAARRSPGRRWRPARPSPGNIRAALLQGDNSVGEFYSVALTNNYQQADTGTKMIHIGKNTRSTIVSKGISAGHGQNSYRGLVKIQKSAANARNFSQCDSLLIGQQVRRAHLPVHRGEEHHGAGRARGHDLEDRRGPDFLLQPARHFDAGRREHDRQWVLQGSVQGAAHGVRGGGAEAAGREPGRQRGLSCDAIPG